MGGTGTVLELAPSAFARTRGKAALSLRLGILFFFLNFALVIMGCGITEI